MATPVSPPGAIRAGPGRITPPPGGTPAGRRAIGRAGPAAAAFAGLGVLAAVARDGPVGSVDQKALDVLRTVRPPAAVAAARMVSALAEPEFAAGLLAARALLTVRRDGWRAATTPPLVVAGGAVARHLLSRVIARPRPPAAGWLAQPAGFSLPSQHTTLAALTAGVLAGSGSSGGLPARTAPLLAAAGVGASRVYLGVHWPTDVVAAWLFTEGWLRLAGRAGPVAPRPRMAAGTAVAATRKEMLIVPDGLELRCSAVVVRQQAVLLIHRTYDSTDDWVLPGGTPRAGESMAACARREVREETGLRVDPARVVFVLEVVGPQSGPRTLDIVFGATESAGDRSPSVLEPGMEPRFIPADRLHELDLRPPLAGHLRGLLGREKDRYAPYLSNLWRPAGSPGGRPRP